MDFLETPIFSHRADPDCPNTHIQIQSGSFTLPQALYTGISWMISSPLPNFNSELFSKKDIQLSGRPGNIGEVIKSTYRELQVSNDDIGKNPMTTNGTDRQTDRQRKGTFRCLKKESNQSLKS